MKFYGSHLLLAAYLTFNILDQQAVLALGEPCFVSEGDHSAPEKSGTCISLRSCTPYLNLVKKHGHQIGDFLRSVRCYDRDKDPIVCCPYSSDEVTDPLIKRRPLPQVTLSNQNINHQSCGYSKVLRTRVVGGGPAPLGAWPWMTILGYRDHWNPTTPMWQCAGSLISTQHVLTAAHCVTSKLYLARLGELDISNDDDGANPIDVPIAIKIPHPGYNTRTYENDIGVLKLEHPITYSAAIHPICLPSSNTRSTDYTDKFHYIAGWGAIYHTGPTSSVLQEAQLPVVSQRKCHSIYQDISGIRVIDERVLCAGLEAGGVNACSGDSGGPLMAPIDDNRYSVIGVVSYSYKCAQPDVPAVYTRVSSYLDFIQENLQT